MGYGTGDVLGVFATNIENDVMNFCKVIGLNPNTVVNLERNDG